MSRRTINPIKNALVAMLNRSGVDGKNLLGLRTIKSDISPQDIVAAIKEELAYFPAALVNYAGRIPTREGTTMRTDLTFAIFLADRDVSGPYVSGEKSIDLMEDIVEAIDGQRFSGEQKKLFEFAGDQLMFQDTTTIIYQLFFRTTTVHQRRF
jgi:hypothetical protein